MRKWRSGPAVAGALLVIGALVGSGPNAGAATGVPLVRGGHVSGVARPEARGGVGGVNRVELRRQAASRCPLELLIELLGVSKSCSQGARIFC